MSETKNSAELAGCPVAGCGCDGLVVGEPGYLTEGFSKFYADDYDDYSDGEEFEDHDADGPIEFSR